MVGRRLPACNPAVRQKLNKQCHRKAWEIQQMPEIRLPNLTAAFGCIFLNEP